jgi:ferredoxin
MGHHLHAKSSLVPLIDRLNRYPVGLVDNGKLREILSLLFEEKEAYVASCFPMAETTLPELSRQTKMSPEELLPVLDVMADKGLIVDMPFEGTTYYLLLPGLIGFFEFTFMKRRADLPMAKLARLMEEYLGERSQATELFGSKTPLTRSLAYEEHVPVTSEITTYERAREIIKEAGYGAVQLCYCRHKKEHVGEKCKKGAPVEGSCISLGAGARFLTRRGFAEEKSVDELLAVLDRARALRLTHITDNIRQRPSFICNCCSCCCEIMHGVKAGFHNGVGKTGFTAVIDPKLCEYCGECFKACNVTAIGAPGGMRFETMEERYAAVREEVCLGCGACVSACKAGALTLFPADNREIPPLKKKDLQLQILKEKGRLPGMPRETR